MGVGVPEPLFFHSIHFSFEQSVRFYGWIMKKDVYLTMLKLRKDVQHNMHIIEGYSPVASCMEEGVIPLFEYLLPKMQL